MKKQRTWTKSWAVCAAVFIGLGMLCQAHAQTTSKDGVAEDDDYYIEWIIPETPPYPPVFQDGKWISWEEAFGPLPKPEPIAVKRPKNPKPPEPFDPNARWLAKKRELAPQLFADGKLKPEAEAMFSRAKENSFAKVKDKKSQLRPKVDAFDPRLSARRQNSQPATRGGPEGGNGPLDSGNPRLELVHVEYVPLLGHTYVELWLIDGPQDEWWDIFRAPTLHPNAWIPQFIGPPDFVFDNVQVFPVWIQGQPPESYFQIFLHQDSDYDGLLDGFEVCVFKTDPNDPDSASTRDTDGDGQPDYPNLAGNGIADGDEDFDGDGLSNIFEMELGVDPLSPQSTSDSDADGLPDWVEEMISYWTGDPDPAPDGDSDWDGVSNAVEMAVGMDPSWGLPNPWFGDPGEPALRDMSFYPDHQRVVQELKFSCQSPDGPNAPLDESYLHMSTIGDYGTVGSLFVMKDQDVDGNYAPGVDTFVFGGCYQTPSQPPSLDDAPAPDPADAELLRTILLQATSTTGTIWQKARVSENLTQLTSQTLVHLQYRCNYRIWVQVRRIQMMQVAGVTPQGVLLRARRAVSIIHTEATILRSATLELGRRTGDGWMKAGRFFRAAGRMASVVSASFTFRDQVYPQLLDYYRDVRRRCDNNEPTALLLAYALGNMTDAFAGGFQAIGAWQVYWLLLSMFDGYESSC